MKVYIDRRDWWIGYYRGDEHDYVCLLPTVVVRWRRGKLESERQDDVVVSRADYDRLPVWLQRDLTRQLAVVRR